jgi:hypothetical protein
MHEADWSVTLSLPHAFTVPINSTGTCCNLSCPTLGYDFRFIPFA